MRTSFLQWALDAIFPAKDGVRCPLALNSSGEEHSNIRRSASLASLIIFPDLQSIKATFPHIEDKILKDDLQKVF